MKTLGYVLLLILGVVLIAAPGSCAFAAPRDTTIP